MWCQSEWEKGENMKKFTNDELVTMALEVYKEFENEIPEEKREESFPLSIVNVSLNAMVKFIAKLQENDKYMQSKVASQLDRLVGKGNYVVTVSTFLTQAPIEKTSIIYDPNQKTAVSEQNFTEKLGDNTSDTNSSANAVSTYLPYGVQNSGSNSSQDRKYVRQAQETQYGVT